MEKNRVTVCVGGQQFSLCGSEDEAYIQSVATYADEKIEELQRANPSLSTSACVILAALNIADELFKLRQQYAQLDQRISELRMISTPEPPAKPTRARAPKAQAPVKHPFEEVKA